METSKTSLTKETLERNCIIFDERVYGPNEIKQAFTPEVNAKRKVLLRFGQPLSPEKTKVLEKEARELTDKWQQSERHRKSLRERQEQWTLLPSPDSYWKPEDYEPTEVKDERNKKEQHFEMCWKIARIASHSARQRDSEANWRTFWEREIFKDLQSTSNYETQRHEYLQQVCLQKEVLWNDRWSLHDIDETIPELSRPKPDITYGYPIFGVNDNYAEEHGDDEYLKAFSYSFLKDLRLSQDADLRLAPAAGIWKKSANKLMNTDLICLPWAVVEFKPGNGFEKPIEFCYCQAANATATAFSIYKMLYNEAERQSVPSVLAFTCIGSEVRVWLTYEETIRDYPGRKMACIFATDVRLTWGVMCILRILENAQQEAKHLKGRLSDHLIAVHRKSLRKPDDQAREFEISLKSGKTITKPTFSNSTLDQQSSSRHSFLQRQNEAGKSTGERNGEHNRWSIPHSHAASPESSEQNSDGSAVGSRYSSESPAPISQPTTFAGHHPTSRLFPPSNLREDHLQEASTLASHVINPDARPKSAEPLLKTSMSSSELHVPRREFPFTFSAASSDFSNPFSKPFAPDKELSKLVAGMSLFSDGAAGGSFDRTAISKSLFSKDATGRDFNQSVTGGSFFAKEATGGGSDKSASGGGLFPDHTAGGGLFSKFASSGPNPGNIPASARRPSYPFADVPSSTASSVPVFAFGKPPLKPLERDADVTVLDPCTLFGRTSPLSFPSACAGKKPDRSDCAKAEYVQDRKEQTVPKRPAKSFTGPNGKRIVVRLPGSPTRLTELGGSSGVADHSATSAPTSLFGTSPGSYKDKPSWNGTAGGSGDSTVIRTSAHNSLPPSSDDAIGSISHKSCHHRRNVVQETHDAALTSFPTLPEFVRAPGERECVTQELHRYHSYAFGKEDKLFRWSDFENHSDSEIDDEDWEDHSASNRTSESDIDNDEYNSSYEIGYDSSDLEPYKGETDNNASCNTENHRSGETESDSWTDTESEISDESANEVEPADVANQDQKITEITYDSGWNDISAGNDVFTERDALDLKRDASAALDGLSLTSLDEFRTLLNKASGFRLYKALRKAMFAPGISDVVSDARHLSPEVESGCDAALQLLNIPHLSIEGRFGGERSLLIEKAVEILFKYSRQDDLRHLFTKAMSSMAGFEVIELLKSCGFSNRSKEWIAMDNRAFEIINRESDCSILEEESSSMTLVSR